MQNVNGSSEAASFILKGKKIVCESGRYNLEKIIQQQQILAEVCGLHSQAPHLSSVEVLQPQIVQAHP